MNILSGLVPPKPTQKRILRCGKCGTVFVGKKFPIPTKCPQCGSFHVKDDERVRY